MFAANVGERVDPQGPRGFVDCLDGIAPLLGDVVDNEIREGQSTAGLRCLI